MEATGLEQGPLTRSMGRRPYEHADGHLQPKREAWSRVPLQWQKQLAMPTS